MSEARESTLVDWSPMLWRLKAPLKIILSCWLAWKNCILTWDNLCRRCLQRPGRCSLYGEELETISHLFFLSRIASGIWETIFAYFKFGSKLLTSLEQSLRWGLGMRGIYCYIPLFVIWEILKARNHQIFIGKQLKAYSISSKIIVWTEGIHPREKHHKDMMGRHLSMMIMPPIEFFWWSSTKGTCDSDAWIRITKHSNYQMHWYGGLGTNTRVELVALLALPWFAMEIQIHSIHIYGIPWFLYKAFWYYIIWSYKAQGLAGEGGCTHSVSHKLQHPAHLQKAKYHH